MSYGRILERNKRKMEKRRFPFLRTVNPRVPKRVLGGVVETMSKFEISNGHNWGAIWSYRAVNPSPESPGRALARGKDFRVPGGWGVGNKLKNVSFLGHFFLNFSRKMKKLMKLVKLARIEFLSMQNESWA